MRDSNNYYVYYSFAQLWLYATGICRAELQLCLESLVACDFFSLWGTSHLLSPTLHFFVFGHVTIGNSDVS